MKDEDDKPLSPQDRERAEKARRLAAALRENLRRRKAPEAQTEPVKPEPDERN